ncbi:aminotransferase class V-fold PLP-dependent enzyme [Dactylosporangium matsuzakiense]|uniref:Aminotransferase n=1 Tax=Dactylosporangium matsuzakiense TaxID=53360 RepID=A0A9W6KPA2_9ACTN|nr:aminotransferase class V-fold PLP-dependent enzyme [Dactylosporangium matsuzakiense]UWZ47688.1 aminotransferase class V-fold PLP-dependent enzyme [Dactylosporangium matsuzakiense]GLL05642.1 aminotransferase [Dactylosporangium matsuzakiense]
MKAEEPPIVRQIRASVIGDGAGVPGPFGVRPLVYADHTASGRVLGFVEDHIREHVMPWYANTHTEASATGRRMTALREEARQQVRAAVQATDRHAVLFCGSGSTAAIDKFIRIIAGGGWPRPVVFVGTYEHHSNELLWRESGAEVIRTTWAGLEGHLRANAGRTMIGSFSAGSNVTGALADVDAVSALLHRYDALACWDYAAAGPHRPIRAHDAVFLSPHKFPGGPGTPGVLVVRKDLIRNPVPTVPGGGTITYVHPGARYYLADPEHREEGGTPAIIESIRAGVVMRLHRQVGLDVIQQRETGYVRRAIQAWRGNPAITILGDPDADRLPIVSFTVDGLHHNLVVTLLSDLFGIQARGGCSCAGPYGHDLLGIGPQQAEHLAEQARAGWLGMKPGWARVSFAYYLGEDEFAYIVDAVHFLAAHGAGFKALYGFDERDGVWRHRHFRANGALTAVQTRDLRGFLDDAQGILAVP